MNQVWFSTVLFFFEWVRSKLLVIQLKREKTLLQAPPWHFVRYNNDSSVNVTGGRDDKLLSLLARKLNFQWVDRSTLHLGSRTSKGKTKPLEDHCVVRPSVCLSAHLFFCLTINMNPNYVITGTSTTIHRREVRAQKYPVTERSKGHLVWFGNEWVFMHFVRYLSLLLPHYWAGFFTIFYFIAKH